MESTSQHSLLAHGESWILNEKCRRICDEIMNRKHVYQDWKEYSVDPSYTNFELPYPLICRERYKEKINEYEQQFQHQIQQLIMQNITAYEALRFQRHMAISSLWPPLHNRREIEDTQRNFFTLSPKERKRLDYIMRTNII